MNKQDLTLPDLKEMQYVLQMLMPKKQNCLEYHSLELWKNASEQNGGARSKPCNKYLFCPSYVWVPGKVTLYVQ